MKTCFILAGGDFDGFYDQINDDDLIIAADRGYEHAVATNIRPDIIIGDFDSTNNPELSNVIKLNPIKDFTDTKAAIMQAVDRGYENIIIYGALGGRESHTIANIRACLEFKMQGVNIVLKSKYKEIFVVDQEYSYEFDDQKDFYVSIFALSDIARGIKISGLYYELDNFDMDISNSLGVSNETCGNDFTISVKEGYLLIIIEKKEMED